MSKLLENELPQTLQEAVLYFADPEKTFETVVNLRWSNGVTCPHCGSKEVGYTCTRKIWKCKNKECRKQFSIKTGTVMEDSPLGLDKWLIVTYAKGKSDVKRKEDLSKNNGKKVYYPRLLSVPAK